MLHAEHSCICRTELDGICIRLRKVHLQRRIGGPTCGVEQNRKASAGVRDEEILYRQEIGVINARQDSDRLGPTVVLNRVRATTCVPKTAREEVPKEEKARRQILCQ